MVGGALFNCFDGEAGGRLVLGHEVVAFRGRRDDIVDTLELAPALLVDDVEQAERPGTAIPEDQL